MDLLLSPSAISTTALLTAIFCYKVAWAPRTSLSGESVVRIDDSNLRYLFSKKANRKVAVIQRLVRPTSCRMTDLNLSKERSNLALVLRVMRSVGHQLCAFP